MTQKTKYIGILTILPLFFIGFSVYNEAIAQESNQDAYVEVRGILEKEKSFYDVRMNIHAGNEDLPAGKLLVTSDRSSKEIDHNKVRANLVSSEKTVIRADDKTSIKVEFVKLSTEPFLVLHDAEPSLVEKNTFTVTIGVHATSKPVQNVQLLVGSDLERIQTIASSAGKSNSNTGLIDAFTHGLTTIRITAMDPNSITAEILNYQIND